LRPAELQEDIDIFMVFEEVVEAHDVLVDQGPVDFDLGKQLLAGS
jgi:hypothetical protein